MDDAIGWKKLFDLTACAVGIANIGDGMGILIASIACGKAAEEWWTE